MEKDRYQKLVSIIERLRDPQDGCPWDIEQTHQTLAKYLEEETNETLELIREPEFDYDDLCEELGDVLLQVLLHSQIAKEAGKFTIDDVLERLTDKLIRRHPHVFGDAVIETKEDLDKQWARIKDEEKRERTKRKAKQ